MTSAGGNHETLALATALPNGPGQVMGSTRLLGGWIKPAGDDVGPLWAVNGNMGNMYFFTADGLFGSRDAEGDQVDDGTYELVGDDTFVIGKVTFHYRIEDGDTLYLDPELPACAKEGCWDAQWAIAVSYPGLPWERIG